MMMRINDDDNHVDDNHVDDNHVDDHDDVGVGWSMKATSSSLLVR